MRRLMLLMAVLLVYGSLFPFDFVAHPDWRSQSGMSGSDVLANIILLLPWGLLLGFAGRSQRLSWPAVSGWALVALLLSALVQIAQAWLPSRDPSLTDVLSNLAGLMLGGVLGALAMPRLARLRLDDRSLPWPALLLTLCWLMATWAPLVPTLDPGLVWGNLKWLWLPRPFFWSRLLPELLAVWTLLCLWREARTPWSPPSVPVPVSVPVPPPRPDSARETGLARRGWPLWLPATLALVAVLLQPLFLHNRLGLEDLLAVPLGWLLAACLPLRWSVRLLALGWTLFLLWRGLWPWQSAPWLKPFGWWPFASWIRGAPLFVLSTVLFKTFVYGALLWCWRQWLGLRAATPVAVLLLAGIELGQRWHLYHTPELSDPLWCLLLALLWAGYERQQRRGLTAASSTLPARSGAA